MIWLTWRQARAQTLIALGALAVLAAGLLWLGVSMRDAFDTTLRGCVSCANQAEIAQFRNAYANPVLASSILLICVPALIGLFWGAPLIARELETGTHRLVWNQGVTRARWLAVKLGLLVLLAVAVTGALSLLLTWAASPMDFVDGARFLRLDFASRNIVPVGYAAFGFVLGALAGLLIRRTVPAMAVTLAVFLAVQVAIAGFARPHLLAPTTDRVAFSSEAIERYNGDLNYTFAGQVMIGNFRMPGAWVLTPQAPLVDASGKEPGKAVVGVCFGNGEPGKAHECLEEKNLFLTIRYHPGTHYWIFQWIELSIYLALAGLLAGLAFWRIRRI